MTEHIVSQRERGNPVAHRKEFIALRLLISSLLISTSAAADRPCPPQIDNADGVTVIGSSQACPVSPGHRSDTPDYQDPLATCSGLVGSRTVAVANVTAFQQAMSNANCGDIIQLAPGTYDAKFSIDKTCPMTSPIIIQGASNYASTVADTFTMKGARTILTGIRFSGPDARVYLGGTNNKVIANKFTDWKLYAITPIAGDQGEIAYNELSEPLPWLASEVGKYPYRAGIRTMEKDASSFHFNAWVHHNYFHDFPQKPDPSYYHSGQSDAIELCQTNREWTYSSPSGWYIEQNLIRKHMQGHGIIDIKCSGAVVRFNTISDSPTSRIDLRYGTGSTLESNWLENSGSTIHGANHRVIGNYMRGGVGIQVASGDQDWNDAPNTGYNQAYNVLVAGNDTNALTVGKAYSTNAKAYPALDSVIEAHSGSKPVLSVEQNTTTRSTTNVKFTPPFKLMANEVGPTALSQASASYLACRRP